MVFRLPPKHILKAGRPVREDSDQSRSPYPLFLTEGSDGELIDPTSMVLMSNFNEPNKNNTVYTDEPITKQTLFQKSPFGLGYTQRWERDSMDKRYVLKTNQTEFVLPHDAEDIKSDTISVFLNGLNLLKGHDYHYDDSNSRILLKHSIQSKDDEIEARYEYFSGNMMKDVLLLPAALMDGLDMNDFTPEFYDIFSIDRLIPNNSALAPFSGYTGRVIKYSITPDGIIGDLQLFKGGTD